MIALYGVFFVIGIAIFFLTGKLPIAIRLAISLLVFASLSVLVTLWAVKIGDKPPPGAVTVSPNDFGETQGEIGGHSSYPKPLEISQVEAERLAAVKLEEYVKKENLSSSQFGKPEVRYAEKDAAGNDYNVWEVYYHSKDKPIRHVSITVGLRGGVELHQMIDRD